MDFSHSSKKRIPTKFPQGELKKLPCPENLRISSWSYDMEGHAKKWVERYCELANRTTQQLYKVSIPCIDDHYFKEEELKSVCELSKGCSQIVLKCLYLARIGRPDIHMWIQTILSCGKHCITMQTGTVSRLRFCRRSWGFKIYFRWNIVYFWKSYVCSNKLDVQETNFSFAQFHRVWNHFSGGWITHGWVACSRSLTYSN